MWRAFWMAFGILAVIIPSGKGIGELGVIRAKHNKNGVREDVIWQGRWKAFSTSTYVRNR